jgi:ribosomal protein S18 acetylase RimI-like enzyme
LVETSSERGRPETAAAGFEVRPSRPSDAGSFLQMWRGVVAERWFVRTETVRWGRRYYRRRFRHSWTEDQASLVAVTGPGGQVVGNLDAAREEGPVTRHIASIGMAVAPEWRGRGIGSALMEEAIRWAREARVEKLALSVYPGNEAARAMYRKFGFEEEGRLTGQSKKSIGYLDEIVMGLWLIERPRDADS